jgi:predicted enzyme related to lactoylglutathione lyase
MEDIESKVNQLKGKGVQFTMEPTNMGNATLAIFEDTCGNKIQLVQA